MPDAAEWVRAADADQVRPGVAHAVRLRGRLLALFEEDGRLHAVDNRCPHMGFPMSKGTLKDGILTCHWHQWQFDAGSGGCLSPGSRGTDLETFRAERREGGVWVELPSSRPGETERQRRSLDRAVFEASTLRAAKSLYSLLEAGAQPAELCRIAALRALPLQDELGAGPVSLAAVAAVLEAAPLSVEDRTLALAHAVRSTALEIRTTSPRRSEIPLPPSPADPAREKARFLGFLEDREVSAAERILVTALRRGDPRERVAEWIFAGATAHVFNNLGHSLDFANKAFELLGRIGWEHAEAVLPPLLPLIANGSRHEEDMAWKRPDDLIALIRKGEAALPGKDNPPGRWKGESALIERLLGEDPEAALGALAEALEAGASYAEAGRALALAASLRVARFHTLNEFADWDTVHHAFSHAHALYRALEAFPDRDLARGLFHAAAYLYLARYLNVPKVQLPHERPHPIPPGSALAGALERRETELAAALAHEGRGRDSTVAELIRAAFTEDASFHTIQHVEASVRLFKSLEGHALRYVPLAGLARWLSTHGPTPRAVRQTVENAIKLQKGEALHEEGRA